MSICVGVLRQKEYTLDNVTLAYFYPLAVTQCKKKEKKKTYL